jgi:hypothetical protein
MNSGLAAWDPECVKMWPTQLGKESHHQNKNGLDHFRNRGDLVLHCYPNPEGLATKISLVP